MATEHLHPLVQTWFKQRFGAPTEAQVGGWPAIAPEQHTLIAAPTGSGKTLAAFLTSFDELIRQEPTGEIIRLSACDPLNLVGIITPGARIPALLGNEVSY